MHNATWKEHISSIDCTPGTLMKIISRMVKRGIIEVEQIWPHFSPSDSDIESDFEFKMNIGYKVFEENWIKK